MTGQVASKLAELGITLPQPAKPVASYVSYQILDNLVYISGQLPMKEGEVAYKGLVGLDLDLDQAKEAARLCALHILSQLQEACAGNLDCVKQCIRLSGFVASGPDFDQHPFVINGASDLIRDVFGDQGRHARAAVGVSSLPLGACVEVEALFEIKRDISFSDLLKSAFRKPLFQRSSS